MSKSRLGKGKDDIFAPPKSVVKEINPMMQEVDVDALNNEGIRPEIQLKQPKGRPLEHKEEWTKVTVVLLDRQIHWLDHLALDIRHNTKVAVSRAELIRSLIAAVEESKVDLSRLGNENGIKDFLLEKLKK